MRLDHRELEADLVAWTAGFTPSGLAREAGLEVTSTGQVKVDATLRSVSHPFVFAAASPEVPDGSWLISWICGLATQESAGQDNMVPPLPPPGPPVHVFALLADMDYYVRRLAADGFMMCTAELQQLARSSRRR